MYYLLISVFYSEIIDNENLKNSPTGLQVAVNGIHVIGSDLFFTNLNKGIFGRIPISLTTGAATGPVDVIVQNVPGDDFYVSPDGTLVEVDIPGRSARVVVESTYLASASAVTVGRTLLDQGSLSNHWKRRSNRAFDFDKKALTQNIHSSIYTEGLDILIA
ncbi:hypothetical protein BO71DRAFT_440704 [Aspergillus ellipticus CBS 707.79]|uniref:Uncharacterized protein n=1 Tax=Aspergillus ellipticus CBS 707.79 TaxID=1448320 RepID=A0A319DCD9_9EURO|nr:hypothetical protein BO71DRAFT_440704 [Aspergillus ellipticus CBS 707.79]